MRALLLTFCLLLPSLAFAQVTEDSVELFKMPVGWRSYQMILSVDSPMMAMIIGEENQVPAKKELVTFDLNQKRVLKRMSLDSKSDYQLTPLPSGAFLIIENTDSTWKISATNYQMQKPQVIYEAVTDDHAFKVGPVFKDANDQLVIFLPQTKHDIIFESLIIDPKTLLRTGGAVFKGKEGEIYDVRITKSAKYVQFTMTSDETSEPTHYVYDAKTAKLLKKIEKTSQETVSFMTFSDDLLLKTSLREKKVYFSFIDLWSGVETESIFMNNLQNNYDATSYIGDLKVIGNDYLEHFDHDGGAQFYKAGQLKPVMVIPYLSIKAPEIDTNKDIVCLSNDTSFEISCSRLPSNSHLFTLKSETEANIYLNNDSNFGLYQNFTTSDSEDISVLDLDTGAELIKQRTSDHVSAWLSPAARSLIVQERVCTVPSEEYPEECRSEVDFMFKLFVRQF